MGQHAVLHEISEKIDKRQIKDKILAPCLHICESSKNTVEAGFLGLCVRNLPRN